MKKAKFMLVAIAVVSIASGALAFKAKTFGLTTIYGAKTANVKPTVTFLQSTTTAAIEPAFYFTTLVSTANVGSTEVYLTNAE